MLKVFLVEDEYVMREGIKNNIDWSSHGYEFCGEASDGELAFPMIQRLKPDIVITDIKMPFMDGLTLSRLIKKEMPWIEIIVLTGYEEFEYAKEGIKIGIAQYLTKPINGRDLLKEVDALAVKIEEKHKEQEIKEKYMREMQENFLQERGELFRYLVTGSRSIAELFDLASRLNIDLSSMWYNIVLLHVQSMNHEQNEYSGSIVEIEQEVGRLNEEYRVLMFDRTTEGKAFIIKGDSEEELLEIWQDYLERLQRIMDAYKQVRYFIGIGVPVNRLTELPASFETASHAFAHRFLTNGSNVVDSRNLRPTGFLGDDGFDIRHVNPKQLDRSKIKEFLKLGDAQETIYFVEEFFNDLGASAMESNLFRQYITMDIYFCVMEFVEDLQVPREEMAAREFNAGLVQDKEASMQYVTDLMNMALELRDKKASNRYGDIVDEVMLYIEQNYADEELSLKTLASHVNFSPNHLSTVFAQQTGQTFIKYLTEYRMNKAKELLRCTGKGSSEIAAEVGYRDPHYFSYLFKKTQGMTPTQYRGGKSQDGEEEA